MTVIAGWRAIRTIRTSIFWNGASCRFFYCSLTVSPRAAYMLAITADPADARTTGQIKEEDRMAIFKGAGVAIVTPMKENLEINYDKLDEIL